MSEILEHKWLNRIITGDARKLARAIPDESIDLIFTDPIYQNIDDYRWLAEMASRILVDGGDLLVYYAHYHIAATIAALAEFLVVRWPLVEKKIGGAAYIWEYDLSCLTKPLLWCTKGQPRKGLKRRDFLWAVPEGRLVHHKWDKGVQKPLVWLARYSKLSDVILDPFCGGGGLIAAAKKLVRRYIAFEIDPITAEEARQFVAQTQPPLLIPEPQQLELSQVP